MDIQRLKEIFDSKSTFAIVVGQGYGVDEMGSALSLYLALKTIGKDASVVSAKQPLVEVSNLVGIDQVRPSYESSNGDLIVSFPYQQDEIGKVSYTLENGLLNIIVKPKDAPLSFGEKDVIFKRSGDLPTVVITVGVKRISELQSFFDVQALKDTTIVNVDKAGANEGYGDVVIIGQGASSVSEQVANLILSLAYPMDPDIAQNLMGGIISATGNFQSPKTSSLAFEMAGILLRSGAKRETSRSAPNAGQSRTPGQFGYPLNRPPQNMPQRQQVNQPRGQRNPGLTGQQMPQIPPMPQPQQPLPSQFAKEQKLDDAPIDSGDTSPDAPPDWLSPKIYKGSTDVE
jgi:nanoRNase/pAp phosphatase (c-di-AMP/oligoRNAs hydrolase)